MLVAIAVLTLLLVFFMPYRVTKTRKGEDALPSTTVERCFIFDAPSVTDSRLINRWREGIISVEISIADIILYLLISSALGAGVWALSGRRTRASAPPDTGAKHEGGCVAGREGDRKPRIPWAIYWLVSIIIGALVAAAGKPERLVSYAIAVAVCGWLNGRRQKPK